MDIDLNAAFSSVISFGFTITRRMSGADKANHCSKPKQRDLAPHPLWLSPAPLKIWLKEKTEKAQGPTQTRLHKMALPPLWGL